MDATQTAQEAAPPARAAGYEFDPQQNVVIRRAGSRTLWWGILTLASGLLMAAITIFALASGSGTEVIAVAGIYGAMALIPITVGLYFIRSGRALKAVVDTTGRDIGHLMRALEMQANAFTVQIAAVVIAFGLGTLAAIAIPKFASTREQAYYAAQRADLRNLASVQEMHADREGTYTADLSALAFAPSTGVELTILEAGATGWSAVTAHAGVDFGGCAIFVGDAAPPLTPGGITPAEEGRPACD